MRISWLLVYPFYKFVTLLLGRWRQNENGSLPSCGQTVNSFFHFYIYFMLFSLNAGEWLDPEPGVMAVGSRNSANERWWNVQEVGPNRRNLGHWGCASEQDAGTWAPLPCLLPIAMKWKALSATCHDVLPHHRPKGNNRLKPLKPWAKINLISYQFDYLRYLSQW
jgi:hypothetical protein